MRSENHSFLSLSILTNRKGEKVKITRSYGRELPIHHSGKLSKFLQEGFTYAIGPKILNEQGGASFFVKKISLILQALELS